MFKFTAGMLIAMASAAVRVNAWSLEFFPNTDCSGLIQSTTSQGPQSCTNLPEGANAFNYQSDGLTLQFFAQQNCGSAFFQGADSSVSCALVGGAQVLSWAIIQL